jgi:hypothetical protein
LFSGTGLIGGTPEPGFPVATPSLLFLSDNAPEAALGPRPPPLGGLAMPLAAARVPAASAPIPEPLADDGVPATGFAFAGVEGVPLILPPAAPAPARVAPATPPLLLSRPVSLAAGLPAAAAVPARENRLPLYEWRTPAPDAAAAPPALLLLPKSTDALIDADPGVFGRPPAERRALAEVGPPAPVPGVIVPAFSSTGDHRRPEVTQKTLVRPCL